MNTFKFNSLISIGVTIHHNNPNGDAITLEDVRLALNSRCADIERELKNDPVSLFEFLCLEDSYENEQDEHLCTE